MSITRVPVRQVLIDFGATPITYGEFTFTDGRVNSNSNLMGNIAYVAPPGRDLDEVEMEPFSISFQPGGGQFIVLVQAIEGPVVGQYYLNYYVG
jgi:hypothetical protein